eukprot:jgi/Hompol1/3304/HPOL_006458-RA
MSLAETTNQKSKIESLLLMAQDMTLSTGAGLDKTGQQELMDGMNERIVANTQSIIQAVKDQLAKEKWVPNREFLQQALRRLQMTTIAIESLHKPVEEEVLEENTFNLGLIRGGDKSPTTLLFNIPNEGNIGFEYRLVANKNEAVFPPDYEPAEQESELGPFQISPMNGFLAPGESINISASFNALAAGSYRQGISLVSGDEVILTFFITARVGNPNLILSPHTLDFGLVEKGKMQSKHFVVSNTGGYQDFWRIEHKAIKIASRDTGIDDDTANSGFKIASDSGETNALENTPIQVDFMPAEEGVYTSEIKVL